MLPDNIIKLQKLTEYSTCTEINDRFMEQNINPEFRVFKYLLCNKGGFENWRKYLIIL